MIWKKAILALFLFSALASAQDQLVPAPLRGNQGEGPFERLIIRGATLIDGTGRRRSSENVSRYICIYGLAN